jgi:hypothetical protein
MRLFKRAPKEPIAARPLPSDIEKVRDKIAAVERDIADAGEELNRLALHAALADDQSASGATARLDELRHRRDLLTRALAAAEQAERERVTARHHRDLQARRRAAAQHAGRLEKLSRSVSEAEATLLSEFGKLTEAAAALVATLPSHMKTNAEGWQDHLGPAAVRTMALMEGYRLARQQRTSFFERPPGAGAVERPADGSLPSLSERVSALTSQIRSHFNNSIVSAVREGAVKPLPKTEHLADAPLPVCAPASIIDDGLTPPVVSDRGLAALGLTGVFVDRNGKLTDLTERWVAEAAEEPTEEPIAAPDEDAADTETAAHAGAEEHLEVTEND